MPTTPRRHVAYGCAGQLHQLIAAVTEHPIEEGAEHLDKTRSSREQKPGDDDRDEELDEAEQRILGELEQLAASRLEHRRHLGQCSLYIGSGELP